MAKAARLVHPISLVGTSTQKHMIENEAAASRVSMGDVVRLAIDEHFGLVDGEVTNGGVHEPRGHVWPPAVSA